MWQNVKLRKKVILGFFITFFITSVVYTTTGSYSIKADNLSSNGNSLFSYNNYAVETNYQFQRALSKYLNYTEVLEFLKALELEYPDLVDLTSIGKSYEGRTLWLIKITNKLSQVANKNQVLLIGVHHAREYISLMVPLYIAYQLVNEFYTNSTIQKILNYTTYYIIPLLNPDGYLEALYHNPWQRKNTHRIDEDNDGLFGEDCPEDVNGDGIIGYLINNKTGEWFYEGVDNDGDGKINEDWVGGVDLNRNYNFSWGSDEGASSDKHAETYFGISPFSENETHALRDFVESIVRQGLSFSFAISYHSGIRAILYPWGYTSDTPDDEVLLKYADFLSNITNYQDIQGYDLYPVSGEWSDWLYGIYHIPSYTIEVYYDAVEFNKLKETPTQTINGSWYIPFNVTKFFNPNEKEITNVAFPNYKAVIELSYSLIPPEKEEINMLFWGIIGVILIAAVAIVVFVIWTKHRKKIV